MTIGSITNGESGSSVRGKLNSVIGFVNASDIVQRVYSPPTGDPTGQTAELISVLEDAMQNNKIVVLSGSYTVNGPITLDVTGNLQIEILGSASISTSVGSSIYYLFSVDSAANSVTIKGGRLTINGDDRIKAGIRLNNSGASENGFVHIENVEVNDCLNSDNAFGNTVGGIVAIGKYRDVVIKTVKVKEARNTGTNLSAEVSGISVTGYTNHCHIDNVQIVDITNTNLADADGIKVFGDRSGFDTNTTCNYVPQTALVENSVCEDCQGRGIKFQTSEAEVRSTKIKNLTVATISSGSGIAFQWGNGIVDNCKFEFASGMIGASYSLINFQNVLEDATYQRSRFSNSHIKTVDAIPRIVSIQEENGAYLGTGDCRVEVLNITGERAGGTSLVSRAIVEHVTPQRIVDKTGGTEIVIRDCVFPLTGFPVIGYVSYTSGDLSSKLDIVFRGNRNTLNPASGSSIVFNALSGTKIVAFGLDMGNNEGFNCIFYSDVTVDFDALKPGTVFGVQVGGTNVTISNWPGTALSAGLHIVEALANWYPNDLNMVRVTNTGTGVIRFKYNNTSY